MLPPTSSPPSPRRRGMSVIMLLLGVLLMGLLSIPMLQMFKSGPAANGPANPIERSFDAVCQVNKVQITQALQLYSLNHPPMTKLDLKALALHIQMPPNCPCSYEFDATGKVVCKVHH